MNNFTLCSLISKVVWSDDEKQTIQEQLLSFSTTEIQQVFYNYAKKWKLAPWTYSQLKKHDFLGLLKVEIINLFRDEYEKVKLQNEKRNETAQLFLKEFKAAGIEVIVLKGNLFAHTIYHDVGYKRMNDFDILIQRKDWDRIQDIYLQLGFIPLGFGWSGEKEKPADFSHVGMSFISKDYSCIIGSQWGLKSPTTGFTVDIDDVWKKSVAFDFYGQEVKALSPEYNLLHLILHMGIYKCGIRDCMDVYNLLLSTPLDQDKLYKILVRSNAVDKAVFTLELCNLCCVTLSIAELRKLKDKKSGYLMRRIHKRLETAKATGDFQCSYNDYFQDIEKEVIYFNLFPKFHLKFIFYCKILGKIFFAKSFFALKLNDKAQSPGLWNKLTSRIKAPYYIFSLIAQEIGWKFTILLFLKLWIDLLFSIKNYFVKTESYFDYLKRKNIDPKDISQAVKNIQ